jgi:hypothetical protein
MGTISAIAASAAAGFFFLEIDDARTIMAMTPAKTMPAIIQVAAIINLFFR